MFLYTATHHCTICQKQKFYFFLHTALFIVNFEVLYFWKKINPPSPHTSSFLLLTPCSSSYLLTLPHFPPPPLCNFLLPHFFSSSLILPHLPHFTSFCLIVPLSASNLLLPPHASSGCLVSLPLPPSTSFFSFYFMLTPSTLFCLLVLNFPLVGSMKID